MNEKEMWLQCLGEYASIVDRINESKSLLYEIKSADMLDEFSTVIKMNGVAESIKEQCEKLLNSNKQLLSYWENQDKSIDEFAEFQQTDLVKHDPGERSLLRNHNQRNYLISKGPHQPVLNKFPIDDKGDRFNPMWYKQFPHLEYSVVKNSAFCFVCFLFPSLDSSSIEKGHTKWFTDGVQKFGKMTSRGGKGKNKKLGKLQAHFSSSLHKKALQDYRNFMVETGHVDIALDKVARNDLLEVIRRKNFHAEVVRILMDVTRTLARQGLALRGSGNDSDGNFVQMVQLVARHNPILKEWLEKTSERPYHVTYLSPKSQNEFIELLGETVKQEIIREIQSAPFYTIMADTTPDVSHKDILSLIIRFVDEEGIPKERLLKVIEAKDKTGVGIADCIQSVLNSSQITTDNLVFQSYDMAANMSGQFQGAQQIISEKVGHEVYFTPCQAHRTNTAIEHCCRADTSSIIANMFNILEELYTFFSGSTKRFSLLKTNLEDVENSLNLKNLSKTRWTVRAESIKSVIISFEKIVNVLEEYLNDATLSKSFDRVTKSKVLGLYKNIRSADFIASLFFMKTIMYKLKVLTETLESVELNILDAITAINTSISSLNKIRSSDTEVENLIEAVKKFCNKISVEMEEDFNKHHRRRLVPRRYDENNENAIQLTCTEFYKQEFNSVLDSLISQLTSNVQACMEHFRPAYEVFQIPISRENISVENLQLMIDMFPNSSNKPDVLVLEGELELLFDNCSKVKSFQDVANVCFKMKKIIPTACTLIRFLSSAGYTTASNERIFSRLKYVKNELRNRCLDDRLDFLMVLFCERDITDSINFQTAVEHWITLKNRRIKL